jgi:hypothetical protein
VEGVVVVAVAVVVVASGVSRNFVRRGSTNSVENRTEGR